MAILDAWFFATIRPVSGHHFSAAPAQEHSEFRAILRAALCGRTPSPRGSAGIVERQENRDTFESTTTSAIAKRLEEKHAAIAQAARRFPMYLLGGIYRS
jgi:hypothetical protein